jgi:hypothetical protein
MAIRVLLDTNVLSALDPACELLATYSDLVPDPAALEAKFPNSHLIYIDRGLGDPSGKASVADIETGALTINDVPGWLDRKEAAGIKYRTIYESRGEIDAIQAAAGKRTFWHWVATLDGTAFIARFRALHGPAVVQILPSSKLGYHADLSLVFEDGWHPTHANIGRHALKRELNGAISVASQLSSDLHRMAAHI